MLKKILLAKAYQLVSAAARNGLIVLGSYLEGQQAITGEDSSNLVTAGMVVFGVLWSVARKFLPTDLKI